MMMRRRRALQDHPTVSHERWLVSYADFVTLLFAFFVVMFANSQVDEQKLGRFTQSLRSETHAQDVQAPLLPALPAGRDNVIDPRALGVGPVPHAIGAPTSAPATGALAEAIRAGRVRMMQTPEGTTITLQDQAFFRSGSAQVEADALGDLESIAHLLRERVASSPNTEIRIEGYTDSQPTHNFLYRSNWELSSARAAAVLTVLTRYASIPSDRFAVVGYADRNPTDSNDTDEGRRKNRRVVIVVRDAPNPVVTPPSTAAPPSAPVPQNP